MPAFNEGDKIYQNICETRNILEGMNLPFEIIVVDDGSTDNTWEEVQRACVDFSDVIPRRNDFNMGKGWALKRGFSKTSGDIIVFLDADLDLHPKQIKNLMDVMDRGGHDAVITSKHHPDSQLEYPFFRRVFSFVYFLIIRVLFGLPVRDTQTGLKLFRSDLLKKVFPLMLVKKFAYDIELLATAHHFGYSIIEMPIVLNFKRVMKWGRIGFKDIFGIWIDTLAVFYRLRLLKYYDRLLLPLIEKPPVSIIVVSENEETANLIINECLRQDYTDFEVVIVIRHGIVADNPQVRIIAAEGMSRIEMMNLGANNAKGEMLAFIHEESYPHQDWLLNAVRNFSDYDNGAVCGPIASSESENIMSRAAGIIYSSFLVGGLKSYRYVQRPSRLLTRYPSTNLIIRKSVFNMIGGFDEDCDPYEGEVFCMRMIKKADKKLHYDPDVLVYLRPVPLFFPFIKWVCKKALHRGNFLRRHFLPGEILHTLLPTLFILFALFGGIVYSKWLFFDILYSFVMGFYLLTVFLSALKNFSLRLLLPVISGILIYHIVYGLCFPIGFAGLGRQNSNRN